MPVFTYAGRDQEGRPVSGDVEATSPTLASRQLAERGIIIMELHQSVERRTSWLRRAFGPIFLGVSLGSLMAFYRQFGGLIQSGVIISQALDTLSRSAPSGRLRRIAQKARDHVQQGGKLSDALAEYPWIFDRLQMALIETGESSGGLDVMLLRCAEYLERENELRNLLRRITFYPKLVLFVAAIISYYFVRSLFMTVFPLAAVAIIAVWLILRIGNQNSGFRLFWDQIKLAVPFLGGAVRGLAAARFASALSLLFRSGVPVTRAVRTAAMAAGNAVVESGVLRVAPMLDEGHTLSETLTHAKVFPRIVLSMLSTGEQAGTVDSSMEKVREYLEIEGRTRMEQIAWVVAIGLYLLVAFLVFLVVTQFYGGLYSGMME